MKMGKAKWVILALAWYVGISCIVFRFRNPELTEVQALMHIVDALMWRNLG